MNTNNPPEEHPEIASRPCQGVHSVLLVEDDANFRMIIEITLKKQGYAVSVADSAGEAIEIATQNKEIQLLITDVAMPGMNGIELAEQIQRILPRVKVLAISGFPQKVVAGMGVWTDSIHFLQKPFPPAQLHERIRAILAGT